MPLRTLAAKAAPAGWHRLPMTGDGSVLADLAYPPQMHPVAGDRGAASAARLSPAGAYLMYLNATPRQGQESLRDWPSFRVGHLLEDDASKARLLGVSRGVRFLGGTGTCVLDTYVTRIKANHYTEIACFVQGAISASVIVAAAPAAGWARVSGLLLRAVAAYQVR